MTSIEIPDVHPTNNNGLDVLSMTAQEKINTEYAAKFMAFLAEIGAHVVVEYVTTIHTTVVDFSYVIIKECAPVVLAQIMEHYETFAVNVMEGKGVVVDVTLPKARKNARHE